MIIDVACQLEKVMEFLAKAGFDHDRLLDFKPSKDDQLEVTLDVRECNWSSETFCRGH